VSPCGPAARSSAAVILNIAMTNFFNRINRTTRDQAGQTWRPGRRPIHGN
jgi:hypothetical protein